MSRKTSPWILYLAPVLLAAAACRTSAPPRYYLLSAPSQATAPTAGGPEARRPAIGVGPISFPDYLDRPQIVTRRGASELELAELHRWAEPLAGSFTQALADHLAARAAGSVHVFPWPAGTRLDYRLKAVVIRFDAEEGGRAVLEVRWQVLDGEGAAVVPMRRSSYTEASTPGDYGDMVTALGATIAAWSEEIADCARGGGLRTGGAEETGLSDRGLRRPSRSTSRRGRPRPRRRSRSKASRRRSASAWRPRSTWSRCEAASTAQRLPGS